MTGDISSLSALTSLQELILHGALVTGDLSSLNALASLQKLSLHYTQVTGDISSLSALTSLHIIDLSETCITGFVYARHQVRYETHSRTKRSYEKRRVLRTATNRSSDTESL